MIRLIMENELVVDVESSDVGHGPYKVIDSNFGRMSDVTHQVHFLRKEPEPGDKLSIRSYLIDSKTEQIQSEAEYWYPRNRIVRIEEITV